MKLLMSVTPDEACRMKKESTILFIWHIPTKLRYKIDQILFVQRGASDWTSAHVFGFRCAEFGVYTHGNRTDIHVVVPKHPEFTVPVQALIRPLELVKNLGSVDEESRRLTRAPIYWCYVE